MWPIHPTSPYSIKNGMKGWPVWSLQAGLRNLGTSIAVDGDFGPQTEFAVINYQQRHSLFTDGIAGPITQRHIASRVAPTVVDVYGLPVGLMDGFCQNEGGWLLAAVNWGVPGGVDCGIVQRRVYEHNYKDFSVVSKAFDSKYQIEILAKALRNNRNLYLTRAGVNMNNSFAWRLSALSHNYPLASDTISKVGLSGLSAYWTTQQQWVTNIQAKFADGVLVRTPLEWCQFYALGSTKHSHKGLVTKYVDWTKVQ